METWNHVDYLATAFISSTAQLVVLIVAWRKIQKALTPHKPSARRRKKPTAHTPIRPRRASAKSGIIGGGRMPHPPPEGDPFQKIESFCIRAVALLLLLHTLFIIVRHEFGL